MEVALTPLRFLVQSESLEPNKLAIVCGEHRLTYKEYAQRVRRLKGALGRLGVSRGDRVAYLGLNCHRLLELYYAVPAREAILSPLNVRLTAPELTFILGDLEAKLLFTDKTLMPMAERLAQGVPGIQVVLLDGELPPGWLGYEELMANGPEESFSAEGVDDSQTAEIFYTSGTTGRPKGVMLTHRNLHQHALSMSLSLPVKRDEIQLVGTVPLFHVNGWGAPQYMAMQAATQVITPRFDPKDFFRLVSQEGVTLAMMVPTMLAALLEFPDRQAYDTSSLERILIGGAPPPPSLIRRARETLGIQCTVGYGLSETCPVLTIANVKESLRNLPEEEKDEIRARTGLPIVGVELRVAGSDGQEVAHDDQTVGEIWARGDMVSPGYWRRPEETEASFQGGWFRTGDMAVVSPEGYLNIVDRKKDIIISGGENISSVEVENALYSHPAVLEAAVVAVPDDRWGEVPYAFVALRQGMTPTADEILSHLKERLATFKIPKTIEFQGELPKTGTGKVMKQELRRPFWEGR